MRVLDLTLSFSPYSRKILNPESLIVLFSSENLVKLSLLANVKPFPGRNMIKLLKSDNLFPPLRHSL